MIAFAVPQHVLDRVSPHPTHLDRCFPPDYRASEVGSRPMGFLTFLELAAPQILD